MLTGLAAHAYNFAGVWQGSGSCILGKSNAVEFKIIQTAKDFVVRKCYYGGYQFGSTKAEFYCSAMHYPMTIRNGNELWDYSNPAQKIGSITSDEISVQVVTVNYATTWFIKHDGDHLYFSLSMIQNGSLFEMSEAHLVKIP